MQELEKSQNKEELRKQRILINGLICLSLFLILLAFLSPLILTQPAPSENLDFSESGNIGSTIGGITAPFIGLAGICVTFLAFYIQYKFNKFQMNLFERERINNNRKYSRDKFENQFYEMLRLHKENVKEISIKIIRGENGVRKEEHILYGRKVFEYLTYELHIIILVAAYTFKRERSKKFYQEHLSRAYEVFFSGLINIKEIDEDYKKNLLKLQKHIADHEYAKFDEEIEKNLKSLENKISKKIEYEIFNGHDEDLGHYYRHLFQTVKFVAEKSETELSYEEKRNYLRILRAQLSNKEQALLFYNWYSGYGKNWNNSENKYFTDYRMIHNLNPRDLMSVFDLEDIFKDKNYRKEKNRDFDPLFEFQEKTVGNKDVHRP